MDKQVEINLDKIIEYQRKKGLTDTQFAQEIGISKASFSRVKHGKRNVGVAFIKGLIKAGMKTNDIFLIKRFPNGN